MQTAAVGHAFDGRDLARLQVGRQRQTREHGRAVDEHRARAALSELAAVLGADEIEILAQDFEQRLVDGDEQLARLAVDCEAEANVHRLPAVCCADSWTWFIDSEDDFKNTESTGGRQVLGRGGGGLAQLRVLIATEVHECFTSLRGCWVHRSASSCCFSFCPATNVRSLTFWHTIGSNAVRPAPTTAFASTTKSMVLPIPTRRGRRSSSRMGSGGTPISGTSTSPRSPHATGSYCGSRAVTRARTVLKIPRAIRSRAGCWISRPCSTACACAPRTSAGSRSAPASPPASRSRSPRACARCS